MCSDVATSSPAVLVEGLRYSYGDQPVLAGIDLRIEAGEVFAILGGNGAGKSTLLKLMLGLLRPQAGRISLCGVDPALAPQAACARLAYVPETAALYPHLSGMENLRYLLGIASLRRPDAELHAALDRVGLDRAARDRRAGAYSKGMRQRVAIALAMLRDVRLLLMDEPDSGLDPEAEAQLAASIRGMREEGRTVVLVSHDLHAVSDLADRFAFLSAGRVARESRDAAALGLDIAALRALYARRPEAR